MISQVRLQPRTGYRVQVFVNNETRYLRSTMVPGFESQAHIWPTFDEAYAAASLANLEYEWYPESVS